MGILQTVLAGFADEHEDEISVRTERDAAEVAMATAIAEHAARRTKTAVSDTSASDPVPLKDMLERRAGGDRRYFDFDLPDDFQDRRAGLDRRRPSVAFGKRGQRGE